MSSVTRRSTLSYDQNLRSAEHGIRRAHAPAGTTRARTRGRAKGRPYDPRPKRNARLNSLFTAVAHFGVAPCRAGHTSALLWPLRGKGTGLSERPPSPLYRERPSPAEGLWPAGGARVRACGRCPKMSMLWWLRKETVMPKSRKASRSPSRTHPCRRRGCGNLVRLACRKQGGPLTGAEITALVSATRSRGPSSRSICLRRLHFRPGNRGYGRRYIWAHGASTAPALRRFPQPRLHELLSISLGRAASTTCERRAPQRAHDHRGQSQQAVRV